MKKGTVGNGMECSEAATALEKVTSGIVGFPNRIRIRMITDKKEYRFRLDLEDIDSAQKVRAAHYLNHKMRACMHRNRNDLLRLADSYLNLNSDGGVYFIDDILEDWIAGEFEKSRFAMAKEYQRYSQAPYTAPKWQMINGPLTKDLEGIEPGDLGAVIMCPPAMKIDGDIKELLSENVNFHAGVHLNENFRMVKSVFCTNGMESHDLLSMFDEHSVPSDHAQGTASILFFEVQRERVEFRPHVFEVMGLK